jgi:hypothetical protein
MAIKPTSRMFHSNVYPLFLKTKLMNIAKRFESDSNNFLIHNHNFIYECVYIAKMDKRLKYYLN